MFGGISDEDFPGLLLPHLKTHGTSIPSLFSLDLVSFSVSLRSILVMIRSEDDKLADLFAGMFCLNPLGRVSAKSAMGHGCFSSWPLVADQISGLDVLVPVDEASLSDRSPSYQYAVAVDSDASVYHCEAFFADGASPDYMALDDRDCFGQDSPSPDYMALVDRDPVVLAALVSDAVESPEAYCFGQDHVMHDDVSDAVRKEPDADVFAKAYANAAVMDFSFF